MNAKEATLLYTRHSCRSMHQEANLKAVCMLRIAGKKLMRALSGQMSECRAAVSHLVLEQVLISWHVTVHLHAFTHFVAMTMTPRMLRITIMRQPC